MRRRKLVLTLTALAVVLGTLTAGAVLTLQDDRVATLDGEAVSRDELLFQMRRLERSVQDPGDTSVLAQQALEEIRSNHALLDLAEERGLVASTDYEGFLDELEQENSARSSSSDTVYGVKSFRAEEYYAHREAELTTALVGALSAHSSDPLWVSDEEVRQEFEADRDAWSENATTFTYTELTVPEDASVESVGRLEDVDVPGTRLSKGEYTPGAANGLNTHTQDLAAVLTSLSPGEVSAPVLGTEQTTYYRLDRRSVDEDTALETYSSRIRQSLAREKFQALLEQREGAIDFTVDTSAVEAIDAEDVQG